MSCLACRQAGSRRGCDFHRVYSTQEFRQLPKWAIEGMLAARIKGLRIRSIMPAHERSPRKYSITWIDESGILSSADYWLAYPDKMVRLLADYLLRKYPGDDSLQHVAFGTHVVASELGYTVVWSVSKMTHGVTRVSRPIATGNTIQMVIAEFLLKMEGAVSDRLDREEATAGSGVVSDAVD